MDGPDGRIGLRHQGSEVLNNGSKIGLLYEFELQHGFAFSLPQYTKLLRRTRGEDEGRPRLVRP